MLSEPDGFVYGGFELVVAPERKRPREKSVVSREMSSDSGGGVNDASDLKVVS